MQLTCPACGAKTSLEAMTEDAAARRVAALFGELPPVVARSVPAYLAYWRPAKTGLRWTRTEAILSELVAMVAAGFRRGHKRCRPAADTWAEALQQVCDRDLRRPLKSHGYLQEIALGLAERFESVQEESEIQRKRAGGHRAAASSDPTEQAIQAVLANFERGFIDEQTRDQNIEQIRALGRD